MHIIRYLILHFHPLLPESMLSVGERKKYGETGRAESKEEKAVGDACHWWDRPDDTGVSFHRKIQRKALTRHLPTCSAIGCPREPVRAAYQ